MDIHFADLEVGGFLPSKRGKMAEELKSRFVRARLAAMLEHELREGGKSLATSHVAIVPQMGYLVAIGNEDSVTIRLVED